MTNKEAKKMTLTVNTMLLMFVIGMLAFFYLFSVTALVYFSIPTIGIYILGYFLINNNKINFYIKLIYFWIIIYMCITTICLGYNFGFHLYCMSLIPVLFCTDYMAYKLNAESVNPVFISIFISVAYLFCVVYTVINGPYYVTNQLVNGMFLIFNSLVVFGFLIFYNNTLIRMVIDSERQLKNMAHVDKLTGVYNRHYMLNHMNDLLTDNNANIAAMVDIDNFKKINDTYGHECGDYVLVHLCDIMKDVCEGCTVSRWGGEEFLIVTDDKAVEIDIFERLREKVASKSFKYGAIEINVTVTIGAAEFSADETINDWINDADKKLYYGKNNGKNRLVK